MTPPRFELDKALSSQNALRQDNVKHYPVLSEEVNNERKKKYSLDQPGS
jgi:hypothetical protein